MAWFEEQGQEILESIRQLLADCKVLSQQVQNLQITQDACCKETQNKLNQLQNDVDEIQQELGQLLPGPAASFSAIVTLDAQGESNMPAPRAVRVAGDLQVGDDGTYTVTPTFYDGAGVPTTNVPSGVSLSYAGSDATPGPSALSVSPNPDPNTGAKGVINQATIQALVAAAIATGTPVVLPTRHLRHRDLCWWPNWPNRSNQRACNPGDRCHSRHRRIVCCG